MRELETFVSLLAVRDIERTKALTTFVHDSLKDKLQVVLQEYKGLDEAARRSHAIKNIKQYIALRNIKLFSFIHPSWIKDYLKDEKQVIRAIVLRNMSRQIAQRVLALYDDAEKEQIQACKPRTKLSRAINEIIKFGLIQQLGIGSLELEEFLLQDHVFRLFFRFDFQVHELLAFINSCEILAWFKLYRDSVEDNVFERLEEKLKEKGIYDVLHVLGDTAPLEPDIDLFFSLITTGSKIEPDYLVIPFIRLFAYAAHFDDADDIVRALAFRMDIRYGRSFLAFCREQRGRPPAVGHESNTQRLLQTMNLFKRKKKEEMHD